MADQKNENKVKKFTISEEESAFRKEIEDYYLLKQLVDAIYDLGEIPKYSIITHIGIGFIDIAGYSYISKFLEPKREPGGAERPVYRAQLGYQPPRRLPQQD